MYELVGYRYVDMADGGKEIKGNSCWFLAEENDDDFHGRSGVKVFFSDDKFPEFSPNLGDRYLLIFNQKGKLQAFQKLDG